MKSFSIALLAAGLLAAGSAAAATERESVSLKVDATSVNFADPASVAALRRQVERHRMVYATLGEKMGGEIEEACNPGDRAGADMKPDFKCRREMVANLDPTLHQLALRATQQRMATVE